MAEKTAVIASTSGLHARPAAIFARKAGELNVEVTIEKEGGKPVPASSIVMLMTLGAEHGDEVILRAEGEGAQEALDELAALAETDLDERG